MLRTWRVLWVLIGCFVSAAAAAQVTTAQTTTVVEFYHAGLDHYFISGDPLEIDALDTGRLPGWVRTGFTFTALTSTAPSGVGISPVCRFYGAPLAGLDSHFYSASPPECALVAGNFPAWKLESANVFQVYLPDPQSGACPGNTVPVYRSWNRRRDSSHRYTTDAGIQAAMVAQGYVAEGYGNPPVAMCAVAASGSPASGPAPACSIAASSNVAPVGTNVVLTATCSNAPTSYAWSGCASTGPVCTASSSDIGPVAYTVTATNAYGSGTARTTVVWQPQNNGTTNLTCTVTASATTASVGTAVTLTANCVGAAVASYVWSGCASSGASCSATAASPGPVTYSVVAVDANGSRSPPASVTVTWTAAPTSVPVCALAVLPNANPAINTTITLQATCSNTPANGYDWTGCTSTTATCFATSSTPGSVTYGVRGVNPSTGAGAFAFITVTWH